MGTTCTAVAIHGDQLAFAHVGDSRAYLLRRGTLRQLTQDHSLVAQLVARGQITREEARHDPRRNVVTRSVGVGAAVEIDAQDMGEPLQPGDTILVCSDGLHGLVSEEELARLGADGSLDRACRTLIALANERGGPDNITVAMARIESEGGEYDAPPPRVAAPEHHAPPSRASAAPGRGRARTMQWLLVALVALFLTLAGIAWVVFGMLRQAPEASSAGSSPDSGAAAPGSALAWR
jgi:protein phosphatase